MAYNLIEILKILEINFMQIGKYLDAIFYDIRPILEAKENSLVFISDDIKDRDIILEMTKSKLIICNNVSNINKKLLNEKCFIQVMNPSLVIKKICDFLFNSEQRIGIMPSSYVDHDAEMGESVYIGHFSYVGKCKIGNNVVIGEHCTIYDNVVIGNNVNIQAGSVIGCLSFNFIEDENRKKVLFPQIGRVIIGNDVHIGTNTYIARGSLGDTTISNEVKIYGNVDIGHNVKIGYRSMIYPHVFIAGSTIIGNDTRIYMSSSIKDHLVIGDRVIVSMGSVIKRNIANNQVYF